MCGAVHEGIGTAGFLFCFAPALRLRPWVAAVGLIIKSKTCVVVNQHQFKLTLIAIEAPSPCTVCHSGHLSAVVLATMHVFAMRGGVAKHQNFHGVNSRVVPLSAYRAPESRNVHTVKSLRNSHYVKHAPVTNPVRAIWQNTLASVVAAWHVACSFASPSSAPPPRTLVGHRLFYMADSARRRNEV